MSEGDVMRLTEVYDRLRELLDVELSRYGELNEALEKKQRAIVAGDLEVIRECLGRESVCTKRALAAAEARTRFIAEMNVHRGRRADEPALGKFIDESPPPHRDRLQARHRKLRESLETVVRLNRENRRLLAVGLECVRGMIRLILGETDDEAELYDVTGAAPTGGAKSRILNCRV